MTGRRTVRRRLIAVTIGALIGGGIYVARPWPAGDEGAGAAPGDTSVEADTPMPEPVDEFVTFGRTPREDVAQSDPHYVATGLRTLAGALDSLDVGGDELALDLRVASAHVLLKPASLDIAALVRGLAIRTTQALPPSEAGRIAASRAMAISGERSLMEQQQAVQTFFAAVGDALDGHRSAMTVTTPPMRRSSVSVARGAPAEPAGSAAPGTANPPLTRFPGGPLPRTLET